MDVDAIRAAIDRLGDTLGRLDPGLLSGADAARLVDDVTRAERVCVAARLRLARRVEESNAWTTDGSRSAADFLARKTGQSRSTANRDLNFAAQLANSPAAAEALAEGAISEDMAREIASAATVAPDAETELVDLARGAASLAELMERARRARAAAEDAEARYRRLCRNRRLRRWTDRDGATRGDFALPPDVGARLFAAIDARADELFHQARRQGRRERSDAYAVDALVELVMAGTAGDGSGSDTPAATVTVRVDYQALVRGYPTDTEVCEVPGVGPVPVGAVRAWLSDSILSVILLDDCDVRAIRHRGRTINRALRRALLERDQTCVVPNCDTRRGLEIDHIQPVTDGGPTALDNLCRLCRYHHYLKTHCGWRIEGRPGRWRWIAPGTRPDQPGPDRPGPDDPDGGPPPAAAVRSPTHQRPDQLLLT